MDVLGQQPLVTLICAELLLLLVNSAGITVLCKVGEQRTPTEQLEVKRGLFRSIALQMTIFVPASAILVLLVIRPLLLNSEIVRSVTKDSGSSEVAFYGLLGIISYGFPFVTVRQLVVQVALSTLKQFASIAHTAKKRPEKEKVDELGA